MPPFSIPDLCLRAVAAALPAHQVRNDELDLFDSPEAEDFVRTVGINTRRVAPPALCASDLCVAAAQRVMELAGVQATEIGALVFVTQTPDYLLPGNSMLAQYRLGLPASTFLLDVNQGCAGYVYGIASLASLMSAAKIGKGLLLVGDTITRLVSRKDRSTLPLFSDAGSATLFERVLGARAMHFNLGSDGRGADVICVRGGGARQPFGPESLLLHDEEHKATRAAIHLSIRGVDVLHYTLKYVASNIKELLEFADAGGETPDYYVFHQANHIVNQCLLKKLGIVPERAPETLRDYGNTSCATIPLTICRRLGKQLAQGRNTLLLSGFGAGFSWGSAFISGESILCPEPFEIYDSEASQSLSPSPSPRLHRGGV